MITGFNHNFTYQKLKLHIQTEDCGVKKPRIETHLFRDGIVVASRKTTYDDILKVDDLGRVVEELMKDQHREMLRQLKSGEYDQKLGVVSGPKQDESLEVLENLPEELDLDQLSVEALAPVGGKVDSASGETEVEKNEVDSEPLEAIEVEEEAAEPEALEVVEVEEEAEEVVEAETAGNTEEETLTLEELVQRYLLGESGKGLKGHTL